MVFGKMLPAARMCIPWALLLGAWALVAQVGVFDPFLFPSPRDVLAQLVLLLLGERIVDVGITVAKILLAALLGLAIGFLAGVALYRTDWLYDSMSPLMDFFRSIPATALFPLAILFFGIGDPTSIALAVWICAIYLSLYVSNGLRGASEAGLLVARTLQKSEWDILVHIRLREALPMIFVGLRTAVSLTIVVVVVTEMFVGTAHGLGKLLIDASYTYNIPLLYAGILLTGLIGYLFNGGITRLERRIVHWQGK